MGSGPCRVQAGGRAGARSGARGGSTERGEALGELGSVGITLVVATVISLAGGYYLDRWLGTSPVARLIGLGLGIAVGFVNLARSLKRH